MGLFIHIFWLLVEVLFWVWMTTFVAIYVYKGFKKAFEGSAQKEQK